MAKSKEKTQRFTVRVRRGMKTVLKHLNDSGALNLENEPFKSLNAAEKGDLEASLTWMKQETAEV